MVTSQPVTTTIIASLAMVITQTNAAFVVLGYKYIDVRGASMRVVVAYRLILATFVLIGSTFVGERYIKKLKSKERQKLRMNWTVLLLAFLCGLFGGSLGSNLYVASLDSTSTTIATAISNLSPVVTFILALIFRREYLAINNWVGRAKIIGTIVVIVGAMILSFYKGVIVKIWPANWHIGSSDYKKSFEQFQQPHIHNELLGILLALATSVSSSASIIVQDILLQHYPSQMRTTTLIIGMGAAQSTLYAGITDRDSNNWRPDFTIIVVVVYAAVVASGLTMVLTSWCISRKGSFFVSVFSPITLTVVVILSPLVVGEPLYLGSVIGAIVIYSGIYLVIWGKKDDSKINKQVQKAREGVEMEAATQDQQLFVIL